MRHIRIWDVLIPLHAKDMHPVPGREAQELAQQILTITQEALSTGIDWRLVDRVYFLKGKLQAIETLCKELVN